MVHLERLVDIAEDAAGNGGAITGRVFGYPGVALARTEVLLLDTLAEIGNTSSRTLEVDFQEAVNGTRTHYLYAGVNNIVARVVGKTRETAICVNAHYDSVPYSPGASDNGAAVATGLETLRVLANVREADYSYIFLFNGAEEVGLLGSHAFAEKHAWAASCKVMLNLDSAGGWGQQLLFQSTPHAPWLTHAFDAGVQRPFASSALQAVYQSNILPSDTDYTVFETYPYMAILDFALVSGGYHYHTRLDGLQDYDPGTLQFMGTNLALLVSHLGSDKAVTKEGISSRETPVVFYDFMGYSAQVYSFHTATGLAMGVIAATFAMIVVAALLEFKDLSMAIAIYDYVLPVFFGFLSVPLTWAAGIAFALLYAAILGSAHPSSFYRSPSLAVFIYGTPALFGMAVMQAVVYWLFRQWKLRRFNPDVISYLGPSFDITYEAEKYEDAELVDEGRGSTHKNSCWRRANPQSPTDTDIEMYTYWGGVFFWIFVLVLVLLHAPSASYVPTWWASFGFLGALVAECFRLAVVKTRIGSYFGALTDPRDARPWIVQCGIACTPPLLVMLAIARIAVIMIAPITGRIGEGQLVGDVFMALIVSLFTVSSTVFFWPFTHRAGNRGKIMVLLAVLLALSSLTGFVSVRWDATHPRRVNLIHGTYQTREAVVAPAVANGTHAIDVVRVDDKDEGTNFLGIAKWNAGSLSAIAEDMAAGKMFNDKPSDCSLPTMNGFLKLDAQCLLPKHGGPMIGSPNVTAPLLELTSATVDGGRWTTHWSVTTVGASNWRLFIGDADVLDWSCAGKPEAKSGEFDGKFYFDFVGLQPGTTDFFLTMSASKPSPTFEMRTGYLTPTDAWAAALDGLTDHVALTGEAPIMAVSKWKVELAA